jgi:hypothetical protein
MKKNEATVKTPKFGCEFCGREFLRATTELNHICQYKHRWLEKDKQGNRIGFQSWLQFYKTTTLRSKIRTYEDFIKSPYYTAFIKFGNYCAEINAINVPRYIDWLLKNKTKIDTWRSDKLYTKYLIEYLREEDPYDAIHRSIETIIRLAPDEAIQPKDYLRYVNPNKICYTITTGKISPWILYQSTSGTKFLSTLDNDQVKMISDYINPELWAIKFLKEKDTVPHIKELLTTGGY